MLVCGWRGVACMHVYSWMYVCTRIVHVCVHLCMTILSTPSLSYIWLTPPPAKRGVEAGRRAPPVCSTGEGGGERDEGGVR